MQTNRFRILIISSVIVLAGIIGVQAFWIISTSKIQKEKFDQATMNSLQSVVKGIEKKEAVAQVIRKIKNPQVGGYDLFITEDTSQYIKKFDLSNPFFQDQLLIDTNKQSNFPELLQIEHPQVNDSSIFIIKKTQKRVWQSSGVISPVGGDSLLQKQLNQKAVLVNDIVNELAFISINRDLNDRVNFHTLDSIVRSELRQHGIHTPVITDIIDSRTGNLTINNSSNLREEIYESSYRISLFPNTYLLDSDYLVLFFPERSTFILQSMWEIVTLSILTILILAGLIYISLSTIFKQKKLSRVKNDFINNMTHELKTPISTISLACEALNDKSVTLPYERRQSFIKMIDVENKRLSTLVDNVLKSAVWDSAEFKLKKSAFSLNEVVKEVANSFKIQIEKKGGKLVVDFDHTNDCILADRVHIANVIFNLLDNANKYSNNAPLIKVKLKNVKDEIQLEIADNGIGISPADQKRIFEKFYRVPTGDLHNVKGFGLGLNYVKSIIEKHNGTILLHSQVGSGTTCRIRIPICKN